MTEEQKTRNIVIDYIKADGTKHRVHCVSMYAREVTDWTYPIKVRKPYQFGKKEVLVNMKVGETKRVPFFGVGGYNGWHSTRSLLKRTFKDEKGKPVCDWRFEVDDYKAEIIITRTK